mmetsp:Transcript_91935/g.159216  ORF Transcript_91935/g.159216 Transcript_91935/m.159216 type:complete len:147 (+) Transcript_91935:2-442(+)
MAACPHIKYPDVAAISAYAKGEDYGPSVAIADGYSEVQSIPKVQEPTPPGFGVGTAGTPSWKYETLILLFAGGASVAFVGAGFCLAAFLLMRKYWHRRWLVLTAAPTDVPLCHVPNADDGLKDLPEGGQGLHVSLPDASSAEYQQC